MRRQAIALTNGVEHVDYLLALLFRDAGALVMHINPVPAKAQAALSKPRHDVRHYAQSGKMLRIHMA
jgi:hypothetical protein